ncbi:BHLH domain-containing protein [Chloropicon primus]|uniref:BHLH domain-containing protein n=1 Tax=Chloropicon primus TaxID=1764295 RepID=A0A5B8ML83_9CHLO|nr:hypothetical protein A3770_03p26600 [Chloropicon primus]UPQ99354.1 BHLH domain-containing protein [Chloropicon primus]|mmetsp:Transcript_6593/g.19406  ORF Transcript_6593/g.19406 Transcript_6593/m.19406 type:complete len:269 (+) Transcript_6593:265-1071(+)|eukprot:QDZ20142.1 hypothetical protein A3770_03p26600 [Chloropicon primus]
MTIVNTIPVTGAQLVRPLAVMPSGAAMAPTSIQMSPLVPSPLAMTGAAMDPVSFQQWWQAVSQLNGSRPGTPLAALNAQVGPFSRIASPTLEQMQELQQQQQQQRAPQQASAGVKTKGSNKSGKGKLGSSRSSSPANLVGGAEAPANSGLPLKASRHKYAEQRRRNRINERLDQLRTLVPHTEGSNIAGFLDQVIEYVMKLQQQLDIDPQAGQQQVCDVAQVVRTNNVEGQQKASNTTDEKQGKREAKAEGKAEDSQADRPAKKAKRN